MFNFFSNLPFYMNQSLGRSNPYQNFNNYGRQLFQNMPSQAPFPHVSSNSPHMPITTLPVQQPVDMNQPIGPPTLPTPMPVSMPEPTGLMNFMPQGKPFNDPTFTPQGKPFQNGGFNPMGNPFQEIPFTFRGGKQY